MVLTVSELEDKVRDDQNDLSAGDALLHKLGYKQELLRGINGIMSFSIAFTVCAIIPGIAQLYNYGLATGGPAVMGKVE